MQTREFHKQLESIEDLIREIESAGDPALLSKAKQLTQVVMDLHGAGLDRILELARASGEAGRDLVNRLGQDNLVSSLLVLHGIHPLSFDDRVRKGVESVRLRGSDVEILSIEGGAVRLRAQPSNSKADTRAIIEESLYRTAPDIATLAIEGLNDRPDFVSLQSLSNPELALSGNGKGTL
jgi:hypothetical protein